MRCNQPGEGAHPGVYVPRGDCPSESDNHGKVDEEAVLDANGDVRCINVEKGRWHSLECLESGSVLLESKDGAYAPLGEEDVMG